MQACPLHSLPHIHYISESAFLGFGNDFEQIAYDLTTCFLLQGLEYVPQLQGGDTIVHAKLVSGRDRLVLPEGQATSLASSESNTLES